MIAIKTERTQIHFLSDVLVAVASLDLKVPILAGKRDSRVSRRHSTTGWREQVIKCKTRFLFTILPSREGLTSFSINNCTNFFGEKKKKKKKK